MFITVREQPMIDAILTLNSGSSSIKFALFEADGGSDIPRIAGKIRGIGTQPVFVAVGADGHLLAPDGLARIDAGAGHDTLIGALLGWIDNHDDGFRLVMAGHRVVHGGRTYMGPVEINRDIVADLARLAPLAPMHQPHSLAAIKAMAAASPGLRQIACFDTSFHRTQPSVAQSFALPRHLTEAGVLKYGFHGLSYEYIASVLPEQMPTVAAGRVVVAHLGSGASLCAMKDRCSVATTMGFTALDGLVMGRRPGRLDCGVVLYLLQDMGMSPADVQHLLYRQSGLLGVSGISNDMRVLLGSSDPAARAAIDLFCYRAASELAGLCVALGGLDGIVFTAGIGENAPEIRKRICSQLEWMGVVLDETANAAGEARISAVSSKVTVHVIATNEELVIARAARGALNN